MGETAKRRGDDNHRNWERKSEQLTKTHDINLVTNDQEGKRNSLVPVHHRRNQGTNLEPDNKTVSETEKAGVTNAVMSLK